MITAKRLGISQCKSRTKSALGWFHDYDGNIIGGIMLGFGMTLTGACPGTVLVQVASGIRSGYPALAGGLLGGLLYAQLGPYLHKPITAVTKQDQDDKQEEIAETVYHHFSMKESHAVIVFEIICLIIILSATYVTSGSSNGLLHPIVGGLLIGGAQAASLALTGNAVGVSTAYEQIGRLFQHFFSSAFSTKKASKFPALRSVPFATGILAGSYMLSWAIPISVPGSEALVSMGRAVSGGILMVFGGRLAGGCTSGHGISGLSTLSISSIFTVASIFAGGIGFAAIGPVWQK